MRTTQWVGLNERAKGIIYDGKTQLDYVIRGQKIYPDGTTADHYEEVHAPVVRSQSSGRCTHGMFDETIPLTDYHFPDGTVLQEHEQASPWSSGPVIFTALKKEVNGKWEWLPESLWSEEEINRNT